MDLADPDLPPGIRVPVLGADAPQGVDHERYRRLCAAFDAMPRRSRVVLALRLSFEGRKRLTLRAIGSLLGVGHERIRQIEARAITDLVWAWFPGGVRDPSMDAKAAEVCRIVGLAIDRYPLDRDTLPGDGR